MAGPTERRLVSSNAPWESIMGYSRLVRVGNLIWVTGTTSLDPQGNPLGEGDAYAQTCQIFRNIERALEEVGATLGDIVRTRMYVTNIQRAWQGVGRGHAEFMGAIRPATTMVEVSRLIAEWMLVEIEADAIVTGPT